MVDMRSDTVTRPTSGMWDAMRSAELGDDVLGDDPTVHRLQDMAAERMGKEAALFTPSGTMANQIAIRLLTQPGDEVVVEAGAHPFNYESGAPAMISGVQIRTVPSADGILDPADVAKCFRPSDPHFAPLKLICAEDTANRGGGTPYPVGVLDQLCQVAGDGGASTHLDGARLFNAAVATGISAQRRASGFETVSFCLSKGLGAPVGSLLCGPKPLIHRGIWIRKALGGGMRQAGLLAAAGIYALNHHVDRLAQDHERARTLAEGLRKAGYECPVPPSNMLYVDVQDAPAAQDDLEARGIRCLAVSDTTLRLVIHLDVDDDGIQKAITVFGELSDTMLPA